VVERRENAAASARPLRRRPHCPSLGCHDEGRFHSYLQIDAQVYALKMEAVLALTGRRQPYGFACQLLAWKLPASSEEENINQPRRYLGIVVNVLAFVLLGVSIHPCLRDFVAVPFLSDLQQVDAVARPASMHSKFTRGRVEIDEPFIVHRGRDEAFPNQGNVGCTESPTKW